MQRLSCALALTLLLTCDQAAEPDPPRPSAVSVTPSAAELTALGATLRLTAQIRDQSGQPMPSAAVAWTSGAPAVAAVDGAGVVTAVADGTAAIMATAGKGVSSMATVTVAQVARSVTVTPSADTASVGDTLRLTALVADGNGHRIARPAVWGSSDTAVAVVDDSGLVTGISQGSVWITASADDNAAAAARLVFLTYHPTRRADLMQAVQDVGGTVPLVAGRDALVRVFLTQPWGGQTRVSGVRASFYEGESLLLSRKLRGWSATPPPPGLQMPGFWPGKLLPSEWRIDGGNAIATDLIGGSLIQPGVEMVVEVEVAPPLPGGSGIVRIPGEGRIALDVHALPTMELTIVPFFDGRSWSPGDSLVTHYIEMVEDMATDPGYGPAHEVMRAPRALLPTNDWKVTAHEPVWHSTSMGDDDRFRALRGLRALGGGRGYWMGTGPGSASMAMGNTILSPLEGSTIAHELGHSMGLGHAYSGAGENGVDPYAPALVGVWGWYDEVYHRFVEPLTPALMSYRIADCYWRDYHAGRVDRNTCPRRFITPYHFTKALHARRGEPWQQETAAFRAPTRTLLLWGGDTESGGLHLDPAFVVDAAPTLPDSTGGYKLTGRDASGRVLFTLPFAMPEVADANERVGVFVYTLPVRPGWEALASVTLAAPDGRTAVLDGSTDRLMTILRDPRTGKVRAFLDGPSSAARADGGGEDLAAKLGAVAITSRGIPDATAWRR